MYSFFRQLGQIMRVAFKGLLEKPEADFTPRKRMLSSDSYENVPIVYRAHPIGQKQDS